MTRKEELQNLIDTAQAELNEIEAKEPKEDNKPFHVRIKAAIEWTTTLSATSREAAESTARRNFDNDLIDFINRTDAVKIDSIEAVELLPISCPSCSAPIHPNALYCYPYACPGCSKRFNEKLEEK
jgi:hypothetical protein